MYVMYAEAIYTLYAEALLSFHIPGDQAAIVFRFSRKQRI